MKEGKFKNIILDVGGIIFDDSKDNIEKVLNDEITPETAVDNMAKTINSALEKYNKSNK